MQRNIKLRLLNKDNNVLCHIFATYFLEEKSVDKYGKIYFQDIITGSFHEDIRCCLESLEKYTVNRDNSAYEKLIKYCCEDELLLTKVLCLEVIDYYL